MDRMVRLFRIIFKFAFIQLNVRCVGVDDARRKRLWKLKKLASDKLAAAI